MGQAVRIRAVSEEERKAIERLAQSRTAAVRLVERGRLLHLSLHGQPVPAIAQALHLSQETVRLWLKRFNRAGLDALADASRSVVP
jgi:transposase-like protein